MARGKRCSERRDIRRPYVAVSIPRGRNLRKWALADDVLKRELDYHEKLYSGFAQRHFARPAVRALRARPL